MEDSEADSRRQLENLSEILEKFSEIRGLQGNLVKSAKLYVDLQQKAPEKKQMPEKRTSPQTTLRSKHKYTGVRCNVLYCLNVL